MSNQEQTPETPPQEDQTAKHSMMEVTFVNYVTSLVLQAMIFLGEMPNPLTHEVEKNLDQAKTDFLLDEQSNRIGAMILHLAATEKIYQVMTFENRRYNTAEAAFWDTPMGLGDTGRKELINKPIKYYLDKWAEVRAETLRQLKSKDDNWLSSEVSGRNMNNHWAWFHVMEHQANHMGQINMLRKRMN